MNEEDLMAGLADDMRKTHERNKRLDDPYGPIPSASSHFGGEIGDKIPFEGLKGLNRKESLVIPKSGVWKVGGRLQELKEGTIIEWLG